MAQASTGKSVCANITDYSARPLSSADAEGVFFSGGGNPLSLLTERCVRRRQAIKGYGRKRGSLEASPVPEHSFPIWGGKKGHVKIPLSL